MKYVTYSIELDRQTIDTSNLFAIPMPTARGTITDLAVQTHPSRLDALRRVEGNNERTRHQKGPLVWMLAVEIDPDFAPDIEGVWPQGESGLMEASVFLAFRFMSPTIEEEELLRIDRELNWN